MNFGVLIYFLYFYAHLVFYFIERIFMRIMKLMREREWKNSWNVYWFQEFKIYLLLIVIQP